MIFDEESLRKTLSKAHNFTAVGMSVLGAGATKAAAFNAGVAVSSLAATAIGTGVSAYGQAQQGKAANAVAQRNAQIQLRDAQIAQQNAEFNARMKEKQDDQRRRAMIAKQGGSGVEAVEGTNLLALAEQEFIDDMNAQLIRRGGSMQAQGLQDQAVLTSASGTVARKSGMVGAGSSLLTGLGQTGMQYRTLDQQGVFKTT
ncbi:MAG: hypothetical protein ACPGRH_06710 [Alphaproteobacteria bacterium]